MTGSKNPADVASRRRLPRTGTGLSAFRLTRNLIGGIVLLAALAGWSIDYQSTQRMAASVEQAALSQAVIVSVRGVGVALSRAAAAVRSAQAHADNRRLDDYRTAAAAYRQEMATLRRLIADTPDQRARLDALERIVMPHLGPLDAAAAGTAPLPAYEPPAEPVVTAIGTLLDEIEAREQALAADRAGDARARARAAILVRTFNAVLAILTIFGALLLFNHDVTRQQRDDARLREALKEADTAHEAQTQFLATVSHEIRTPLNAVSGMSELLLETRLDPEQTRFAKAVHTNAEALSLLIGDLLDSSRIDAGQAFLDPAPFDLRELVGGVAELLVVRAEAKGVALVVDVPPATPRRLVGDRARLRQVLMNLVGNAVKFTERGDVTIRARVEPAVGGSVDLRLAVVDTGIGIPREAQARIFERFVQADRSTVRQYGGTGLGLSISRSLIELMGGRLSLQSEPGRGSTFEAALTLPLAPTQPPPDFGSASLAGVEVLLVQENAALRSINESVLRFAGASVRAVDTAAEAASEIARFAPRVIAVGERLPDSNGFELAKRVWDDRYGATPAISIVLMCSLRAMAARNVGSYGITACVYEPVRQARLIRAVRQAAGLEPETVVDPEPDQSIRHAAAPAMRPHILLVEDNRDTWVQASRILVENGYEVERAENGLEAVSSAAAHDYDLIIMDVALPQIDGIEATRRIRAREADIGGCVPIVALTAHAVDSLRQQALAAGMNDYATKPFEKQQLLDICAKWIDRRPRVLVADDTPDQQLLLARYLSGGGYRVAAVVNGREAVAAVERRRPSLVLLDMNMPVMDGYEAARAIRDLPGGKAVPIVALTAHEGPEERQRCLTAGCTAFLSKPVRRTDLLASVSALLEGPPSSGDADEYPRAATPLPSPHEMSDRIDSLLARRDFEAVAALAASVQAAARRRQLSQLATVSEDLGNAARIEDAEQAAWWGEQLVARLGDASPRLDERAPGDVRGCDTLAHLATLALDVPAAVVTLMIEDRVMIVGAAGVPAELDVSQGLPRAKSLTHVIVDTRHPLLVEDARGSAQLDGALVLSTHGVVAVAGVPLTSPRGTIVGAFCAMDTRPHAWPPVDVAMLEDLAAAAAQLLAAASPPAAPAAGGEASGELVVDNDIVDLMPDYVAARRQDVVTLREYLERRDLQAIARLAHKMKGSGAGYGLSDVSRLGRDLEVAAGSGDSGTIGSLIDDLDGRLARLRIRSADGRVAMEL